MLLFSRLLYLDSIWFSSFIPSLFLILVFQFTNRLINNDLITLVFESFVCFPIPFLLLFFQYGYHVCLLCLTVTFRSVSLFATSGHLLRSKPPSLSSFHIVIHIPLIHRMSINHFFFFTLCFQTIVTIQPVLSLKFQWHVYETGNLFQQFRTANQFIVTFPLSPLVRLSWQNQIRTNKKVFLFSIWFIIIRFVLTFHKLIEKSYLCIAGVELMFTSQFTQIFTNKQTYVTRLLFTKFFRLTTKK